MLPDGWETTKFGTCVKEALYGTSAKGQVSGIPVIGMGHLQDGKVSFANTGFVRLSEKEAKRLRLLKGDILFNRTNSEALVGKVGLVESDSDTVYASYLVRFRLDRTKALPEYVNLLFQSQGIRRQVRRLITKGISQCNINPTSLQKDVLLPLPCTSEQQIIVDAFSSIDDCINYLSISIEQKQKQKKALAQRLLDVKYHTNWTVCRLGSLFRERNETGFARLPLLSIARERGIFPSSENGRKDNSNEDKSTYQRICVGDIGYNTMRMWQGVSALSTLEGIVSPAYTVLIPQDAIDPVFAAHFFKYPPIVNLFDRFSQGLTSDTWSLKFKNFSQIKVFIPSKKEQVSAGRMLSKADLEITLLNQKLDALKEQKKGLMQQLLTGKKRLSLFECTTKERSYACSRG